MTCNGRRKLNLGSGPKRMHLKGYHNVDILPDADCQCDLTQRWPWADDSIDALRADNLLEHFDNDEFLHVLNEAHRVLKPEGVFWFRVPDALLWPDGAFGDPTHMRYFFPRSFLYFDASKPQWRNYGKDYGFLPWHVQVESDVKKTPTGAIGSAFFNVTMIRRN